MQGHTKKPRTEAVSMTFTGPIALMQAAIETMQKLGFQEEQLSASWLAEDSIPWREFSYFKGMPFPGSSLAGFRHREGMTQMKLAERSSIPRRHISEMENGRRPIGKANAKKLAASLNIDPRLLLSI